MRLRALLLTALFALGSSGLMGVWIPGQGSGGSLNAGLIPDALNMPNLSAAPSAPSSGRYKLYFKSGSLYQKSGTGTESAIGGGGSISGMRRRGGNSRASTNTNLINYGTAVYADGTDVSHNDATSATLGSQFTINVTGLYTITVNHYAGGSYGLFLCSNSTVTNTQTDAYTRIVWSSGSSGSSSGRAYTGKFTAGDIVWVHAGGNPTSNDYYNSFEIQRIK